MPVQQDVPPSHWGHFHDHGQSFRVAASLESGEEAWANGRFNIIGFSPKTSPAAYRGSGRQSAARLKTLRQDR